jgi:DnaJ-class molecular chaperone
MVFALSVMRNFAELNFYEILEISIDASPFKIERAYKNALDVYGKDSLLTYSLFSDEERIDIFRRIEDAYNTLIDKTKRTAYDASFKDESSGIGHRVLSIS